jgi:hypothetical protein
VGDGIRGLAVLRGSAALDGKDCGVESKRL